MFDSGMIALRYAARVTDGFKVEVELNEELPLNPLVFACLVNDRLTNEVRQESPWTGMFKYFRLSDESNRLLDKEVKKQVKGERQQK